MRGSARPRGPRPAGNVRCASPPPCRTPRPPRPSPTTCKRCASKRGWSGCRTAGRCGSSTRTACRRRGRLAGFTENPADPRFAAARQVAEATRRRLEDEEERAAPAPRRPEPTLPPLPGPLTSGLILASLVVFIAYTGWLLYDNAGRGGQAMVGILVGRLGGLDVVTNPVQQALSIASLTPSCRATRSTSPGGGSKTFSTARSGGSSRRSSSTSASFTSCSTW